MAFLRARGVPAHLTRQPGGTPLGRRIRSLLLEPEWSPVPEAELFLFLADRAQHVREQIAPLLEAGTWVVSDRYSDSTWAYQLAARNMAEGRERLLRGMLQLAECDCQPDLTLWLDLSPEAALSRLPASADRMEGEGLAFQRRVHAAFSQLQRQYSARIHRVDAMGSVEAVQRRIRHCLRPLLASA